MRRVLLLNNVPAPYFDPLFERVGREAGWELTVCYASSWNRAVGWEEAPQSETTAHRTILLDRRQPWLRARCGSWTAAAVALLGLLVRERPDYLLCYGYTLLPQTTALLWAIATRTPFAIAGDANYHCEVSTGVKRALKRAWLGWLARQSLPFRVPEVIGAYPPLDAASGKPAARGPHSSSNRPSPSTTRSMRGRGAAPRRGRCAKNGALRGRRSFSMSAGSFAARTFIWRSRRCGDCRSREPRS